MMTLEQLLFESKAKVPVARRRRPFPELTFFAALPAVLPRMVVRPGRSLETRTRRRMGVVGFFLLLGFVFGLSVLLGCELLGALGTTPVASQPSIRAEAAPAIAPPLPPLVPAASAAFAPAPIVLAEAPSIRSRPSGRPTAARGSGPRR